MPKVVLTCLSPAAKTLLESQVVSIQNAETKAIFKEIVGAVADCEAGRFIGIEVEETGRRSSSGRIKRKPSAYNLFIRHCIKTEGLALPKCAVRWKALSAAEKARFA